ncbi:unnamed protein product [Bursaphelenchus okinawaensis]|uniref:IRS-type PTB domain-containing protein n=1 Tax=Bursaphelenchus okinawaensis TaxID=465554 RepID=A0A811KBK8_9BILA|nr:unnamed protein product [Bursaphelenchus okinawaensis]CAG9097458.1 unnamed protein product [Bursaphelenchus okinawaensis]
MGNANSNGKLMRIESFANDPTAFRVFVKKRNKFIPGWLKVNEDEIVYFRTASQPQFWPLAFLRRYGYTCAGVFFFESGRRCATGEGLHTFQSHQAEKIFHVVQSRIRSEEFARSRASSVVQHRLNGASTKIHPVQRFCSEGAGNPFLLRRNPSSTVRNPLGNGPMMHSNSSTNVHSTRERERPRSVVSAIEYDVNRINKAPNNLMNSSYSSAVNSLWSSAQRLEGEIVNEHVINNGYETYQSCGSERYMRPYPAPTQLSDQVKYHSYVNVELPEPRYYRETSVASDLMSSASARAPPRTRVQPVAPFMTQSMTQSLILTPTKPQAFDPPGECFPAIDRGRPASTSATPARPIPVPQKPPMEYIQVPLLNRSQTVVQNGADLTKRAPSISQRSDCSSVISASPSMDNQSAVSAPATSRVNYALIDFNKTKALEQFSNVKQKAAEKLRNNRFIRKH